MPEKADKKKDGGLSNKKKLECRIKIADHRYASDLTLQRCTLHSNQVTPLLAISFLLIKNHYVQIIYLHLIFLRTESSVIKQHKCVCSECLVYVFGQTVDSPIFSRHVADQQMLEREIGRLRTLFQQQQQQRVPQLQASTHSRSNSRPGFTICKPVSETQRSQFRARCCLWHLHLRFLCSSLWFYELRKTCYPLYATLCGCQQLQHR